MRRLFSLLLLVCLLPLPVSGNPIPISTVVTSIDLDTDLDPGDEYQNVTAITFIFDQFYRNLTYDQTQLPDLGLNFTGVTLITPNITQSVTIKEHISEYLPDSEIEGNFSYFGSTVVTVVIHPLITSLSSVHFNYTQTLGNGSVLQRSLQVNQSVSIDYPSTDQMTVPVYPEDATTNDSRDSYLARQDLQSNELAYFDAEIYFAVNSWTPVNTFNFRISGDVINHSNTTLLTYDNYPYGTSSLLSSSYHGQEEYYYGNEETSSEKPPALFLHEFSPGNTSLTTTRSFSTTDLNQTVPYDGTYNFWFTTGPPSCLGPEPGCMEIDVEIYEAVVTMENGEMRVDYPELPPTHPSLVTTSSPRLSSSSSDTDSTPFYFMTLAAAMIALPLLSRFFSVSKSHC